MLYFFALLFFLTVPCQAYTGDQIDCNFYLGSPGVADCKQLLKVIETRLLSLAKDGLTDPHAKTKQRLWGFPGQPRYEASRCAPWSNGACSVNTACLIQPNHVMLLRVLQSHLEYGWRAAHFYPGGSRPHPSYYDKMCWVNQPDFWRHCAPRTT